MPLVDAFPELSRGNGWGPQEEQEELGDMRFSLWTGNDPVAQHWWQVVIVGYDKGTICRRGVAHQNSGDNLVEVMSGPVASARTLKRLTASVNKGPTVVDLEDLMSHHGGPRHMVLKMPDTKADPEFGESFAVTKPDGAALESWMTAVIQANCNPNVPLKLAR